MDKRARFNFIYVILAVFGVLFLRDLWVQYHTVAVIPYSEFQVLLRENKVEEIVITESEISSENPYREWSS